MLPSPSPRRPAHGSRHIRLLLGAALLSAGGEGRPAGLQSFGDGADGAPPPAPWVRVLLPGQTRPATRFQIGRVEDQPALQVEAVASYGNLVHSLPNLPGMPGSGSLSWHWRVDELNNAANLRRRSGDDNSLNVCVSFVLPQARVPFVERQLLRLARSRSPVPLPAANVCYVWDATLAEGTRLDNAYSRRVRYLVLRSPPASALHRWFAERRDVAADFLALFGDESPNEVPLLQAVLVGADADNTGGRSLAYLAYLADLADLSLAP